MAKGEYYYLKVQAKAIINGTEFPLNAVHLTYEVDEIASAQLELPIGRQVQGSKIGQISSAMGVFNDIAPFSPVQVMVKIDVPLGRAAPPGKKPGFPVGSWFKAFDGFYSAPLHTKSMAGTASLTVQCFGATAALAGATQYVAGTGIQVGPPNGASHVVTRFGAAKPTLTLYDAVNLHCTNIASDLWASALKPMLDVAVTSTSLWTDGEFGNLAKDALARINKFSVLPRGELDISGGTSGFQASFQKALAKQFTDGFYRIWRDGSDDADLWDVIKACGTCFRFHFVPAVDEDGIVPLCPNLSGEPLLIVDPDEYGVLEAQSLYSPKFYAYLKTVGLYSKAFASSQFQDKAAPSRVVGRATLNSLGEGRTQMVEAPAWILPVAGPAKDALNPGGKVPDKGNPKPVNAPQQSQGQIETLYFQSGIGDRLAESILHEEVFQHRKLAITGRFRMDIAPGSTIQINTAGEAFTGEQQTLFGMVNDVRISIGNSTSGSYAKTRLGLTHVRTKSEHASFTTQFHPLFRSRWIGGPLVQGA